MKDQRDAQSRVNLLVRGVRFLGEKSPASEQTYLKRTKCDAQMGVNLLVRSVKFFEEEFTADEQIGKNAVF
ncbi:hypothetical protein VER_06235 [Veillonella sp. R32]|nr:hypothetical protein VER_06235 [Veillonella sp. R32]